MWMQTTVVHHFECIVYIFLHVLGK